MDAIKAASDGEPTTELVTGMVGDRCANCQAPLAPDQRYCVSCGERRGSPRFSYDTMAAQPDPASAQAPPPRRPRFSSGATLVAGVATLLIAMGVGVLIGHDSTSSTPARAAAPEVITVGGGGAAATNGGTASTGAATGSTTKASKTKVKVTTVHVTAKTAAAATQAAGKVLGSSNNLSHNVSQQVGKPCNGGAGCQNGTFTGNFFPGG